MNWFNQWIAKLYETFIVADRYKTLITGLEKTLIITFGALIIGVIIGTIVAIIKVFALDNKKLKPLDVICNIYLTVIRGTPVVVQLLISFLCSLGQRTAHGLQQSHSESIPAHMLPRLSVRESWRLTADRWRQGVRSG